MVLTKTKLSQTLIALFIIVIIFMEVYKTNPALEDFLEKCALFLKINLFSL
jgi:hypothetical protein